MSMTPTERVARAIWTVADYDTYAVLMRPDNTAAARFHVIAEAHEAADAINAAKALLNEGDTQ